jgi:hypothetical protein
MCILSFSEKEKWKEDREKRKSEDKRGAYSGVSESESWEMLKKKVSQNQRM